MSTLPTMHPEQALAIRRRLGWTQSEAAEALGVRLRTYQYWEMGDRAIPGPAVLLLQRLLSDHENVNNKPANQPVDT